MNRSFVVLVRSCSTQSTRAAPVAAAAAAAVSGNVPKTFVSRKERRLADVVERRFEDGHVWRGVVNVVNPAQPHAAKIVYESYTVDELARVNLIFERQGNTIDYVDSFAKADQVSDVAPLEAAPAEIVVMGRSNCGKSTLLNAVLGRHLANVSQRPGYTRTANRFVCPPFFTLIDVPGYGYAEASPERRKQWGRMEDAFFTDRQAVSRFLLLIDARRGITDLDEQRLERLEQNCRSYQLILTKADKLTPTELRNVVAKTEKRVRSKTQPGAVPTVIATSGLVNNYGVGILRAVLLEAAGQAARFRDPDTIVSGEARIRGIGESELDEKLQRPIQNNLTRQQLLDRHIPANPFAGMSQQELLGGIDQQAKE